MGLNNEEIALQNIACKKHEILINIGSVQNSQQLISLAQEESKEKICRKFFS